MSFWTFDNLREVTAGRWLRRGDDGVLSEPSGVSTDTRTLSRGQVFVALAGARFDGHAYIADAVAAGSPLIVVEREDAADAIDATDAASVAVLKVDSTVRALGQLAASWRRQYAGTVIAVTGSVGKTTTKQLIHAVLSQAHAGRAAPRSFNNHIGVPLTLLNTRPRDRYVVVEVGTNAPGEIQALARIIEPDVAIITAIGRAHLERLGSIVDVAAEKAALLRYLREGGLAIVNGDTPYLAEHLKAVERVIRFGRSDACDLRLTATGPRADGPGQRFVINDRAGFDLPLVGQHNALNALAAVAVGRHMKLSDDQIAAGLLAAPAPAMRLAVSHLGAADAARRITLINDAYNANPESMAAAIAVLSETPTDGRRIAVLGDMAELGDQAPQLHRELGELLTRTNVDAAVLVGPLSLYTAEPLSRQWAAHRVAAIPAWTDATPDAVAARVNAGDTLLIKGSRAAGLERLVPALEQRFGPHSPVA